MESNFFLQVTFSNYGSPEAPNPFSLMTLTIFLVKGLQMLKYLSKATATTLYTLPGGQGDLITGSSVFIKKHFPLVLPVRAIWVAGSSQGSR